MAEASDEAKDIEKLYEYGERLNEAKDKSQVRTFSPNSGRVPFRFPHPLVFLGFPLDVFLCCANSVPICCVACGGLREYTHGS